MDSKLKAKQTSPEKDNDVEENFSDEDFEYEYEDDGDYVYYDNAENSNVSQEKDYDLLQAHFDKADLPSGVEVPLMSLINTSEDCPSSASEVDAGLLQIVQFPRFDTVDSFSDHHFAKSKTLAKKADKSWAKRISKEWKILSTHLPDTMHVRVSEDRMDLLRAAIMGPAGTPYHGGLFFFDCYFPPTYPNKPPRVHYHSRGLHINPNLYKCGKVCLSLLGTWEGKSTEKWIPKDSTMLQVLVSIQALILNEKPFFNEPGYEEMYKHGGGDKRSNKYNEEVFVLSLKTMVYNLRSPPEHFKDLATVHFRKQGRDILLACKAYCNGAMVASDISKFEFHDESSINNSSQFRKEVNAMMNMLVACFSRVGVLNCEDFRLYPNCDIIPDSIDQGNNKNSLV